MPCMCPYKRGDLREQEGVMHSSLSSSLQMPPHILWQDTEYKEDSGRYVLNFQWGNPLRQQGGYLCPSYGRDIKYHDGCKIIWVNSPELRPEDISAGKTQEHIL